MRPWHRFIWLWLGVVSLSGWLAHSIGCACAADLSVLRVGVCPKSPPMIFKEGDRIVGVEAELAAALGQDLRAG